MFESIPALDNALNIVTLGIYKDLLSLIPQHASPSSIALAWIVLIARYALAGVAIYLVANRFLDRKLSLMVVAVALVAIVAVTQPWSLAGEMAKRMGGFESAISSAKMVDYDPSVIKAFEPIFDGVNYANSFMHGIRENVSNIKVPILDVRNGKIGLESVSFGWIYYVLAFAIILLTFYFVKSVSGKLAFALVMAEVGLLLGIGTNLISIILICFALAYMAYLLISKGYIVVSVYPIVVIALLVLSLFEIPKGLLVWILLILMYLVLIPMFYLIGWLIAGFGEILEGREKFGLKVKPKKVLEEQVGVWDELAIAIVLAGLFMVVVGVYGLNLVGIGTFTALSIMLFKS